jgi:hypothetical protein
LVTGFAPDLRRLERVTGLYFGDWLQADDAVEGALLGHVPAPAARRVPGTAP